MAPNTDADTDDFAGESDWDSDTPRFPYGSADRCTARSKQHGRRCRQPAVDGRDVCYFHGGAPGTGPPKGHFNGTKHALYMTRDGYIDRQDDADRAWITDLRASLEDLFRRRHGRGPNLVEEEAMTNIAIDLHRVAWANDWFAEQGLTQTQQQIVEGEAISVERLTLWASEIRKYNKSIVRRMDKLELLGTDDPDTSGGGGFTASTDELTITVVEREREREPDAGDDVDVGERDAGDEHDAT